MRRFTLSKLLMAAGLLMLPAMANAQATHDCNSGCADLPPSDWTTYQTSVVAPGGCLIIIDYKARTNHCTTPFTYEYQLVQIAPSGPNCSDVGVLLKAALNQMIAHNGPNYPPTADGDPCNSHVAISMASCWHWDAIPSVPEPTQGIRPCTDVCCSRRYRICYNSTQGRYIDAVLDPPILGGGITCPNQTPPYDCETFCSVLDDLAVYDDNPIIEKRAVPTEQDDAGTVTVVSSYSAVTVRFDVGARNVRMIELVDAVGSTVRRQPVEPASGSGNTEINTAALPSGHYHVVLRLDDDRTIIRHLDIVR